MQLKSDKEKQMENEKITIPVTFFGLIHGEDAKNAFVTFTAHGLTEHSALEFVKWFAKVCEKAESFDEIYAGPNEYTGSFIVECYNAVSLVLEDFSNDDDICSRYNDAEQIQWMYFVLKELVGEHKEVPTTFTRKQHLEIPIAVY